MDIEGRAAKLSCRRRAILLFMSTSNTHIEP
jgi:hypothetical protein